MAESENAVGEPARAYICAGSNLGDKAEQCQRGFDALDGTPGIRLDAVSPFYRTEPVDYLDQDWFVNAVVRLVTTLSPGELLVRLKEIELEAGRTAGGIRFGPRVLDLDILLYGDRILETPNLVIPHPRMHKRHFVLKPICDIDPAIVHPVLGRTVQSLLEELNIDGQQLSRLPETH